MPSSSDQRDPVELLAEEFAERYRAGERPALSEYTDKYPQWAAEIRELFPALVMMEQLKPVKGEATGPFQGDSIRSGGPHPERLGEYRILRKVGEGGMGIVYEAEQESLGRHVALKVLPFAKLANRTYLERFRREARAAGRLHHTNIVPVFGVGENDGVHYYAMQFIHGEGLDRVLHDLRHLRKQQGSCAASAVEPDTRLSGSIARSLLSGQFAQPQPIGDDNLLQPPPATEPTNHGSSTATSLSGSRSDLTRNIARLGLQAAEALAYAHRQGVIHRDIKPSNLLLDLQGTVWITDFGLAKAEGSEELTETGDIVGTLRFMAPERFNGTSLPQSDIYGLGLTLYEMLTLRPAFEEANRARLIEQILHEEPLTPRRLDARIPRDLETIVLKALAKDPAQRYATAEQLAEDLRRFLADRPIHARRTPWHERAWRWCRRNPRLAVAGSVAAAALLAVAVVSLSFAFYQIETSSQLSQAAADLRQKQEETEEAYRQSQENLRQARDKERQRREALGISARLALGQGLNLMEQGQFDSGLLWLARSLEVAPAEDVDLQRTIRLHLAGWRPQVHSLRAVLDQETQCAFHPQGQLIATAHRDGSIRLHDKSKEWAAGPVLRQHKGGVEALAFKADGTVLLCAGREEPTKRDLKVYRLETATGKPIGAPLALPDGKIEFNQDGQTLVLKNDKGSQLWNAVTARPEGPLVDVKWLSPSGWPARERDGKIVLPATRNSLSRAEHSELVLWDLQTGQAIGEPLVFSATVSSLSPNLRRVVLATLRKDTRQVNLHLWDVTRKQQVGDCLVHGEPPLPNDKFDQLGQQREALSMFSPDNRLVAVAFVSPYDPKKTIPWGKIQFWDTATGKSVGPPLSLETQPLHLAWSPDSKTIAAVGKDKVVRLWEVATARLIGQALIHPTLPAGLVFSPDGKVLVAESYGTPGSPTHLWELAPEQPDGSTQPLSGGRYLAALSADGKTGVLQKNVTASTFEGETGLYEVAGGKAVFPPLRSPNGSLQGDLSPDGKVLVTRSRKYVMQLQDAATGQPLGMPLPWPAGVASWVGFSPDSKTLMTANLRAPSQGINMVDVRLWDARTGKALGNPLPALMAKAPDWALAGASAPPVHCFSPDSKLLALAGPDSEVQLRDTSTGQAVRPLLQPGALVSNLLFSPDGRALLTTGRDRSVRVWDAASGKAIGKPLLHPADVEKTSLSPDGQTIATTCTDKMVRLWRAGTGEMLAAQPSWAGHLLFSPDSRMLLVRQEGPGPGSKEVRLWDTLTGKPMRESIKQDMLENTMGFLSAGKTLLIWSFGTRGIHFWDAATGKPWREPLAPQGPYWPGGIVSAPDGAALAVAHYETREDATKVRFWDPLSRQYRPGLISARGRPQAPLTFSKDGKNLLVHSGNFKFSQTYQVQRWDLDANRAGGPVLELEANHLRWGTDGKTLMSVKTGSGRNFGTVTEEIRLWDLEHGKTIGEPLRLEGTVGTVQSLLLSISPDNSRVLIPEKDRCRLWDPRAGKPLGEPLDHRGFVSAVAFSPDGQTLLIASHVNQQTSEWRIWDAKTGKPRSDPLPYPGFLRSLTFSPDSRLAVFGYQRTRDDANTFFTQVWDISTRQPLGELGQHGSEVYKVIFRPECKTPQFLSHTRNGMVRLWDASSGKTLGPELELGAGLGTIAFSPDGHLFLTSHHPGRHGDGPTQVQVQFWETATQRPLGKRLTPGGGTLVFRPDGKHVVMGVPEALRILQLPSPMEGPADQITRWAQVATGRELDVYGEPRLLPRSTWQQRRQELEPSGPYPVPPDDDRTAEGGRRAPLEIAKLDGHDSGVTFAVFAPDGSLLASTGEDGKVIVRDLKTNKMRHKIAAHKAGVLLAAFAPDARTLATASRDKTVILWDVLKGENRATLVDHTGAVSAIVYSPDGKTLATASDDRTVKLREADTGKVRLTLEGHKQPVIAVAFAPDGKTVISSGGNWNSAETGGEIKAWDVATGKPGWSFGADLGGIWSVAFSPDGKMMAGACLDGSVRLIDPANGKQRAALKGHSEPVIWVTFSPDGQTLASAGIDGKVRLWNAATGEEETVIVCSTRFDRGDRVDRVTFSPDGKTLAGACADGSVRLWRLTSVKRGQ